MIAWVLACGLVLCVVGLVAAVRKIEVLQDDAANDVAHEHAKCMALVAEYVGNQFAARVLEQAALDFDTVEGQTDMRRLALTQHVDPVDRGTTVAQWLRERAGLITGRLVHLDDGTVVENSA